MKMKQLEYLLKVVECGSISTAAQQLFISQPSLSKSIMALEDEYRIQILVRKARGVELTADGKSFVHYARGILTAAHALESNFSSNHGSECSRMFVATQQLDFIYELVLRTYLQNQERNIHYNLIETDRNNVVRQVLDSKVDLGLLVRSNYDAKTYLWNTDAKRLSIHVVARSGVYVCVGPYSPYYHRRSISYQEAEQCLHVVLDMEEAATQDLFVDNSQNHFNMKRIIFFNTINACEHFLLQTDALMFVAKWTTGCFHDKRIRVIPVLPDAGAPATFNELLWLKRAGEPLTPAEMQFLKHLYLHFGNQFPLKLEKRE